jgi:hypothetical protein
MLRISSLESLKSFCCESNRTAFYWQVLECVASMNIDSGSNECRNPRFIGDSQ